MNDSKIQLIINQIDQLIFAQTDKHLDNLQYAILEGSLTNKKYKEIAKKNCRSEKYVKDVGSKLWKILSQVLGEKIDKLNIKSTLYRYYYSHFLSDFL